MSTKYCTLEDIKKVIPEKKIVELLNDTGINSGAINSFNTILPLLESIINDAEAMVDTYLQSRYPLPLATVPKIISKYTIDITRYFLYDRRNIDVTGSVGDGYDIALRQLEKIQNGKFDIGIESTQSFGIKTNKAETDSIFNNSDTTINLDNFF